jgi:hypothetical protein
VVVHREDGAFLGASSCWSYEPGHPWSYGLQERVSSGSWLASSSDCTNDVRGRGEACALRASPPVLPITLPIALWRKCPHRRIQ